MKNFDHIPEDRNDEECLNCGGGILTSPKLIRIIGRFKQYSWICTNCGGEVIMIDEDKDQTCPCCGTEDALTLTQLNKLKESHLYK